jgi:hypothetical protein
MSTRYEIIDVTPGNAGAPYGSTPMSSQIATLGRIINSKVGARKILSGVFSFDSKLCVLVDNEPAAGGKSRSKNSYKKYMKKTRKRN